MKNILLLLLLSGCSTLSPKPELSDLSNELPSWIYSPYDSCSEVQELCATGESKTLAQADAEARKNLASIFEVTVTSEFSVTTSSSQTFPWSGAVKEEVQKSLQESVNQILENVQIKKHAREKGLTYALASLDRAKASELIGSRLTRLDDELNVLWSKRSRTNLRKIVRFYLEREKLNERYSIVSGSPRAARMTYKEIMDWRMTKPQIEALYLKVGQSPDWLTEKLKELLTEAGFKIIVGDAQKAVSLHVASIKEYLNVEGFEKFTFTLNLESFRHGEKNKVLTTSETVTGRSQADALLKVKSLFNDYIEQHLADLNLD
jgi:hypothetical protein